MTSATIHLVAPTRVEERLLGFAQRLAAYVQHRIERRARRRTLALDLLREQQARRHDPRTVDHMLAQMGVSRR